MQYAHDNAVLWHVRECKCLKYRALSCRQRQWFCICRSSVFGSLRLCILINAWVSKRSSVQLLPMHLTQRVCRICSKLFLWSALADPHTKVWVLARCMLMTCVCISPAGYADGSGVLRGVGKGLAGVIGLPVSGALGLVSSVSAGVASATGVRHCEDFSSGLMPQCRCDGVASFSALL